MWINLVYRCKDRGERVAFRDRCKGDYFVCYRKEIFSEQRLQVRGWLSQKCAFSGVQHFGQLLVSLRNLDPTLNADGSVYYNPDKMFPQALPFNNATYIEVSEA